MCCRSSAVRMTKLRGTSSRRPRAARRSPAGVAADTGPFGAARRSGPRRRPSARNSQRPRPSPPCARPRPQRGRARRPWRGTTPVGAREQVRVLPLAQVRRRHAERHRDWQAGDRSRRTAVRNSSARLARPTCCRAAQQHDELLAAEAVQRAWSAHRMRKAPCHLGDHCVAPRVTVLVVDHLEVIDIGHDDRRFAIGAGSDRPELGRPGMQRGAMSRPVSGSRTTA